MYTKSIRDQLRAEEHREEREAADAVLEAGAAFSAFPVITWWDQKQAAAKVRKLEASLRNSTYVKDSVFEEIVNLRGELEKSLNRLDDAVKLHNDALGHLRKAHETLRLKYGIKG